MSSFWVSGCKGSSGLFILVQFFLFNLQLQHDGIKLHVQIVGSFQFALVVLPDVQCVPVQRQLQKKKHKDVNTQKNTFICLVFVFFFFFWVKPEFFSASFDQFLVQSVETRALRLDFFKVVPHLVPPLHLRRQRQSKTHWLRAFERSKTEASIGSRSITNTTV